MSVEALSESMEDYLETIYLLARDRAEARSRDIAARMGVSAPSVSGALRALAGRGLVRHEPYGGATLTAEGEEIAARVQERHVGLRNFLVRVLGIDPEEAESSACRMEHAVSKTVVERLGKLADWAESEGAKKFWANS
jgi:DtxR family transcriptional regulator, Mn-dependent transcriptional regulator